MKTISVLGIDLAKSVFQLHGIDELGNVSLRCQLRRAGLIQRMANLPRCTVAMEACGGAHHWAREFKKLGHEVKLIAPQFVKPYLKSNKNDRNDAEAICEAATRPHMRFVPIKTTHQQDIQSLHRRRSRLVGNRTALINEVRGLVHEYGIVLAKSPAQFRRALVSLLDSERLTPKMCSLLMRAHARLVAMDEEMKWFNDEIERHFEADENCKRIGKIEGIGPITATAVIAALPDPGLFKSGRHFSAFLGLVPRQNSTGGKTTLLGISKRGDVYLRTLLIHGARSVVRHAANKSDKRSLWVNSKDKSRGRNKACVAVANKNARIIWAMLAHGTEYRTAA